MRFVRAHDRESERKRVRRMSDDERAQMGGINMVRTGECTRIRGK